MSVVFDRAVAFYDQTRGPPETAAHDLAALLRSHTALSDRSAVLEIGVGTGRIALPLVRANGYRYTGVDLSREMLATLQRKAGGATIELARADITQLPLKTAELDAVVAVHIFHLVAGWRAAMDEVLRVLKPGGLLLHGHTDEQGVSPTRRLRTKLNELSGADNVAQDAGRLRWPEVGPELATRFGPPHELRTAAWTTSRTAREFIASYGARVWSHTWAVPDDRLAAAVADGSAWAEAEFGSLDAPLRETEVFVWDVYTRP
jgi:ubiquinone/menaquinone biosynthesis C-methylase UbiE